MSNQRNAIDLRPTNQHSHSIADRPASHDRSDHSTTNPASRNTNNRTNTPTITEHRTDRHTRDRLHACDDCDAAHRAPHSPTR
jgi:hypothetical protein